MNIPIVSVHSLIQRLKAAIELREQYPDPEQVNDNQLLKQAMQCIEELQYMKLALLQDNKDCYEKLVKISKLCDDSLIEKQNIISELNKETA